MDQITADIILQLRLPIPSNSSWNMSLVIGCGVNVHFDQLHSWIIPMIRGPFRGDQYFRVLVVRHVILLLWC